MANTIQISESEALTEQSEILTNEPFSLQPCTEIHRDLKEESCSSKIEPKENVEYDPKLHFSISDSQMLPDRIDPSSSTVANENVYSGITCNSMESCESGSKTQEDSAGPYTSLSASNETELRQRKFDQQYKDKSSVNDPDYSKNDNARIDTKSNKFKAPINNHICRKTFIFIFSVLVIFCIFKIVCLVINYQIDQLKIAKEIECRNQIELSESQWLNKSQEIIRSHSTDADKALQCSECTPVHHHVLQKILNSYHSINRTCLKDLQKQNEENNLQIDVKLGEELSAAVNNFTQILTSCLQKRFCSWTRMVRLRSFLSHNTTGAGRHKTAGRRKISIPGVQGITWLDDKIFVIFLLPQKESRVGVYDASTLTALPDIHIPNMKKPAGITGCAHNKLLYVSDADLKCIHRVNLTDYTVIRWNLPKNYKPWGLSVTSNRSLLVTVSFINSSDYCENSLIEYSSEGKLIRRVKLDPSIEWAWQTLELSTDQFIICHGLPSSSLHRVCVINSTGQILKCFGGEMGEGEDRLNTPAALKIDTNMSREIIFVADQWNNRVVMLDYNMTYLGLVQTAERIRWPSGLDLDMSSDRLIVAETKINFVSCD